MGQRTGDGQPLHLAGCGSGRFCFDRKKRSAHPQSRWHSEGVTTDPRHNTDSGWIEEEFLWQAVLSRDASQDGVFLFGVESTGVYCRPSCPSRRPRRRNVRFFRTAGEAERAGFRPCLRCRPCAPENPQAARIASLSAYIKQHLDERLTLGELSRQAGLSPFHLQRLFRRHTGLSPRQYIDECRLRAFKARLREGHNVTRAAADAGYGSGSRVHERAGARLGMTPSEYRKGGPGVGIRYLTAHTSLGVLLVAATGKGICSIRFGNSEREVAAALRSEYPSAEVAPAGALLCEWLETLLRHLAGRQPELDLPLDVRATANERRVWEYLRSLPYGTTVSYGNVAATLGNPKAARAVARACAANPVALAIPCHRVIRGDGNPGGYRWGPERKRMLIETERRSVSA